MINLGSLIGIFQLGMKNEKILNILILTLLLYIYHPQCCIGPQPIKLYFTKK